MIDNEGSAKYVTQYPPELPNINELSEHSISQLTCDTSQPVSRAGRRERKWAGPVILTDSKTIAANWKIIVINSDKYKIK